jgi:DNA-binding MarR family transcriptional regulator
MDEIKPPSWSPLALDANGDGAFTISDLKLWFAEAFFAPGDWSIWLVSARLPGVARFLEVGPDDYGGLLSGFLSGCAWFAVILGVLIGLHGLRVFDDLVTTRIARAYDEARRRSRIALQLIKYRLRSRAAAAAPEAIDVAAGPELDPLELALLAAHAELEPPYALALSEAAGAIGRGRHETQRVLERLVKIKLLDRSTGGAEDGESAHMLSQTGRAFMLLEQLSRHGSQKNAPQGGA